MNRLGRGEDNYEALKISAGGRGLSSSGGGGELGNMIYLWPGDSSSILAYAPTEAGLNSALTAAADGVTVWLPSIEIALTAGITLVAGMTLIGIAESAVLSFTGFSGTAITMAANATCKNFSVILVATGTDSLGIDARFTNTLIDGVSVTVSGGSSSNVAIYMGAPE